jgi:hypothetical protein
MRLPGQTTRSELAVTAYRTLWGDATRSPERRSPRRERLQSRLNAVLTVLTPAEHAYYDQQTRMLGGRP